MRTSRADLLTALESVAPGASPKDIIRQSSCIVFRDGEVFTYNDEVSCRCPSGLPDTVHGATPAKKLLEYLRKSTDDEVAVSCSDRELVLKAGRRSAGFPMERDIVLPLDGVEQPAGWEDLHTDFCESLALVYGCASFNSGGDNFPLSCVHVAEGWVEASDNYQIARHYLDTGITEDFLIRRESVKPITTCGATRWARTLRWVHFQNDSGLVLSCRRHVVPYPDFSAFLETKGAEAYLPEHLGQLLELSANFADGSADEILVEVNLERGKATLRSSGGGGWFQGSEAVEYEGPPVRFFAPPKLLKQLLKQHREFIVAPEKLKVLCGAWGYAAALTRPPEEHDA